MKQTPFLQRLASDYTDVKLTQVTTKRGTFKIGNLVYSTYCPGGRLWEIRGFYVPNYDLVKYQNSPDVHLIDALMKPAFKANFDPVKNGSFDLRMVEYLIMPDIDKHARNVDKLIAMIDAIKKANP